ncbi:MAG: universal stress protein [Mucilaginibacter sp.]|nr:universal stress protein [Mucilaginibacter sp.]
MKTIAVLTDFTPGSEHAARYALHLAQKMKADVLLYSKLLVPAEIIADAQYVFPGENDNDFKTDTENRLKELAAMLSDELKKKNFPGSILPAICCRCEEELITNSICGSESGENIIMTVIAGISQSEEHDSLTANSFRQVLDSSDVPVLIIPEDAVIRNVEKFVFATDASYSDIAYIDTLSGLAKLSTAEILIANVTQSGMLNSEQDATIKRFKEAIVTDVNYSRVYYRSVPNNAMRNGLQWLIENIKFDMLVMVRRNIDSCDFAFNPGLINNQSTYIQRPLLVYPYPGGIQGNTVSDAVR